jgi:hypothetical protein
VDWIGSVASEKPVTRWPLTSTGFRSVTMLDPGCLRNGRYQAALSALREITQLKVDWDSYGSLPIQPLPIEGAWILLQHSVENKHPLPSFSPISGGGLQLDWSLAGEDWEMALMPDGRVECVRTELAGGAQEEYVTTLGASVIHYLPHTITPSADFFTAA